MELTDIKDLKILNQYNLILIRYAEIWLKSQKVKIRMLKILINNIKSALEREKIKYHKYQMSKDSSRVFFFLSNEDLKNAIEVMRRVFGIHSISPALRTSNKQKNIKKRSIEVAEEIFNKGDNFAIRVKRSGSHDFTSMELAANVGEALLERLSHLNLKVNLTNPEKVIHVEVRGDFSYIFTDVIPAPWGGLPIENRKKIFVQDVGRLTDILAGFLLMRRGAEIHPILFKMKENNFNDWKLNWKEIGKYSPYRYFTLNMIDLLSIMEKVLPLLDNDSLICAICRILRLEFIKKIKVIDVPIFEKIDAISDGLSLINNNECDDNIDLESIGLNHLFSGAPIFTPVVGFNEETLEKKIRKVSPNLQKMDYCKLKPTNQHFDAKKVLKTYKELNLETLIDEALNKMTKISLDLIKPSDLFIQKK